MIDINTIGSICSIFALTLVVIPIAIRTMRRGRDTRAESKRKFEDFCKKLAATGTTVSARADLFALASLELMQMQNQINTWNHARTVYFVFAAWTFSFVPLNISTWESGVLLACIATSAVLMAMVSHALGLKAAETFNTYRSQLTSAWEVPVAKRIRDSLQQ